MAKWIVHCAGDSVVRMARVVVARLGSDPRLEEAARTLRERLQPLEERNTAWHNVVDQLVTATSRDKAAYRDLEGCLRELGLVTLATTRGHHDEDPYINLFPDGYGAAVRQPAARIVAFADVVLGKLADHADPRFVSLRERLTVAKDAFVAAHGDLEVLLRSRQEAYEFLQVAKRDFAASVPVARAQAFAACRDRRYVRDLFAPTTQKRYAGNGHEPGTVPGAVSSPVAAEPPDAGAPAGSTDAGPNAPVEAPAAPPREAAA
mgnify:CR=1 FL=1